MLSLGAVSPTQAQLFTDESLSGAAFGGLAGAIIGHNSGRHGGEGAAIGAGAGWLLGTLAHRQRQRAYYSHYSPYASSSYSYEPYYYRPNYAWGGAAFGGIAGGIIGHNSGRHGAEGAAIGAGAGLLLGSIAEHDARRREFAHYGYAPPGYYYSAPTYSAEYAQPETPAPAAVAPAPPPAPVIQNTPASSSPMSSANSLFGR